MNIAEDTSMVSSMDNDTPSHAESLEPLADGTSGRTSSLQDSQEGAGPGELPNGSYGRKPNWNGGHGPPFQEPHPSASVHLLHQHPHLVRAPGVSLG